MPLRVLAAGKNMDAATVEYIGGIEVVKTFNQGERSYKKNTPTPWRKTRQPK